MKRVLIVGLVALVLPGAALAWDGTYPTGDAAGTSVHIIVADSYPVDQTLPQSWATYLGSLPHGAELGRLTLNLMPLSTAADEPVLRRPVARLLRPVDRDDLRRARGPAGRAAGEGDRDARVRPPHREQPERRAVAAEDYGTKRWSSYENICARAAAGTASPGDEGAAYSQNPGEAFAESYRVLALTDARPDAEQLGHRQPELLPERDGAAAAAGGHHLTLDRADACTTCTGRSATARPGRSASRRRSTGSFIARLHAPSKARFALELYNRGTLVARSRTNVRFEICGQRSLTLKVQRLSGQRFLHRGRLQAVDLPLWESPTGTRSSASTAPRARWTRPGSGSAALRARARSA